MTEIYIDGIEMDTDDRVGKIAVTYQNFSFLNLSTVKANYTNRISLPLTTNNKLKLEQMAPLSAISTVPYTNHSIRIVQNGIEIIPSGVCQITGVQDRIEIDVQSGIKGFFDSLEGLYLNDIDLSAYNGLWDNDRHDTVRNATSGLVCPVVNSGQLVDGTTYVDGYTYGSAMIPFIYYHTIMTQIAALVGKTFAGNIFSDANRYLKMAMSTRLVYNDAWLNGDDFINLTLFSQTLGPSFGGFVGTYYVPFTLDGTFLPETLGIWHIQDPFGSSRLNVDYSDTSLKFASCKFVFSFNTGVVAGSISDLDVTLTKNAATPVSVTKTVDGDIVTIESVPIDLMDGDYYRIGLVWANSSLYINGSRGILKIIPLNTTNTDRIQATDWHWYFDQLLPRIALKDFIKDFMRMFGLVCSEKNNVVTFKTIEEVLTGAPTTAELLKENKSRNPDVNYNLTGFGQVNNFYWIVQDDEEFITEDYGKGVFDIDNETIVASKDIYTSLFTASDQITEVRINQAAQITIYDQSGPAFTKAASFGSRLVLLRNDDGVNFRFKSGTDRTDYFIGYFIDKNQTYNLDWQELVDQYYDTYSRVLNNFAGVDQEFLLSQVQAVNMDLLTTKHKDGITYLVEQVSSFVPGKFAKFKMYRILIGS